MSGRNVEVVRQFGEVFATADAGAAWAAALEMMHPEMEMDVTRLPAPGLARVYAGVEEIARFWTEWLDAWGSVGVVEDIEVIDAGDTVVFSANQTLRGKGSGVEVPMPEYAWTVRFRDGKVVNATLYMSRSEALVAAGLPG